MYILFFLCSPMRGNENPKLHDTTHAPLTTNCGILQYESLKRRSWFYANDDALHCNESSS
jgi:hypothetical protein